MSCVSVVAVVGSRWSYYLSSVATSIGLKMYHLPLESSECLVFTSFSAAFCGKFVINIHATEMRKCIQNCNLLFTQRHSMWAKCYIVHTLTMVSDLVYHV